MSDHEDEFKMYDEPVPETDPDGQVYWKYRAGGYRFTKENGHSYGRCGTKGDAQKLIDRYRNAESAPTAEPVAADVPDDPEIGVPDSSGREWQKAFVNAVLHRCVDLGLRDVHLAEKVGISKSHWSEIRNLKKSPRLGTMVSIAEAVGLVIHWSLRQLDDVNENHTKHENTNSD